MVKEAQLCKSDYGGNGVLKCLMGYLCLCPLLVLHSDVEEVIQDSEGIGCWDDVKSEVQVLFAQKKLLGSCLRYILISQLTINVA